MTVEEACESVVVMPSTGNHIYDAALLKIDNSIGIIDAAAPISA